MFLPMRGDKNILQQKMGELETNELPPIAVLGSSLQSQKCPNWHQMMCGLTGGYEWPLCAMADVN